MIIDYEVFKREYVALPNNKRYKDVWEHIVTKQKFKFKRWVDNDRVEIVEIKE